MKAIIIDDEYLARENTKDCLKTWTNIQLIAECSNGLEAINCILQHQPDLVFLDIQMPQINGFEVLEMLEKKPQVIFLTAHDEFAVKAFEANALDYLLKPFSQARFDQAMEKAHLSISKSNDTLAPFKNDQNAQKILVKHQNNIVGIAIKEIVCISAWDDYVKIHTMESCYVKKQTMIHFESILPKNLFYKIHRSHIVNIGYVKSIELSHSDSKTVLLLNGLNLPISRNNDFPRIFRNQ